MQATNALLRLVSGGYERPSAAPTRPPEEAPADDVAELRRELAELRDEMRKSRR
jgi:hypothetical protein